MRIKCKVLGCFCSFAAPLFVLTCVVGWSLMQHLILLPTRWCIASLPVKTLWLCLCPIISDHLCKIILPPLQSNGIRQCYSISPVKPEFPNSIKLAKIRSLKSCTEGSLHHVRNIPVSGCFSPRQVIPWSSWPFQLPVLLLCVLQHLATKKVLPKSSIRIESHPVRGTAWKESKYCILLSATSLCCGLVFLVRDAAWF